MLRRFFHHSDGRKQSHHQRLQNRVVLAGGVASGMAFADMIAVNTALPFIQYDLGIDAIEAHWISEIYLLLIASFILVGGALSDYFGRRRVFRIGLVAFAVASMLCALSGNGDQLLIARAFQGAAAALVAPAALALTNAWFSTEQRGQAVGKWAAISSIIIPLGPLLGGFMVEYFSWNWIFAINVPIALWLFWWTAAIPPAPYDPEPSSLPDWPGACLITITLSVITFMLMELPRGMLNGVQLAGLALLSGIALLLFLRVESGCKNPILPLYLFRQRRFVMINLQTLLMFGAFQGVLFFIPFMLVQLLGFSGIEAGSAFLPISICIIAMSGRVGKMADQIGAGPFLIAGPIVMAIALAGLAQAQADWRYWQNLFGWIMLFSIGLGLIVAPLTHAAVNAAGVGKSGLAAGVNNACARIAVLFSIALFGWLLLAGFADRMQIIGAELGLSATLQAHLAENWQHLAAIEVPTNLDEHLRTSLQDAIHNAWLQSYRTMVLWAALLCAGSSLFGWFAVGKAPILQRWWKE
ncbi:MAG: MFS transporter [Pseudomonadota bacterium]